jgi:hypothetical protein
MLECVLLTLTGFMTLARRKTIKFASAARCTIQQTIGLLNKIEQLLLKHYIFHGLVVDLMHRLHSTFANFVTRATDNDKQMT